MVAVTGLVSSSLFAVSLVVGAQAAFADPGPIQQRSASSVTADALPTVQIDGVAWSEAIVGNTVYVGGKFANARPAGSAPGQNQTPRGNLLAFDVTTGNLITSFAPNLNAQVTDVVASPDGSRIYVVGSFTQADGVARNRIAAYSTATGQLLSFAPYVDATVNAVIATNSTVYVGGIFSNANGVARSRLAAFDATTGALTGWAPTADLDVHAMVFAPNTNNIVIGGAFTNLNGSPVYGVGAVDATTGNSVPWNANKTVQSYGTGAAFLSLTADANAVYGTAYNYNGTGNLEGAFSADPATGNIKWIEDCHGDTYQAYPMNGYLYTVGHPHFCANLGGWPVYNPWAFRHTMSFTANATGTLLHNSQSGYADLYGQPSPSIVDWFPDMDEGTYTGQSQAAWSVTGNGQYLVEGGEFPTVNGVAQQGLVRFAVSSLAPKKQGPQNSGWFFRPSVIATSPTTARVAWQANVDRDDKTLTYEVVRDGDVNHPVYTTTADSEFWNQPNLGFIDTGLTPGGTYGYRIFAHDADGNTVAGDTVSITTPSSGPSAYAADVQADGASHYWRLGESTGSTGYDWTGYDDLTEYSGVTHGVAGAIANDPDAASGFNGTSSGYAVSPTQIPGPNTFSEEAWFKTTSTAGGKIVGFGSGASGTSTNYDRHVYMDTSGKVYFGVYNGSAYTINTPTAYNDGKWHQVVATLSGSGMALYVDGMRIGTNTGTTVGQAYSGYWRVGGDNTWSGAKFFNGSIDDVSIYPSALTIQQVQKHYVDSGRTLNVPAPPSDAYGKAIYADSPDVYWRLNETSGSTALDASPNVANGTYAGGYTLGAASTVAPGTAVTFNGSTGTVGSPATFNNPTTYSEEAWFKTTTTSGGKLLGFGTSKTTNSTTYDRQVYLLNSGQLVFGVNAGGTKVTITSSGSYNDGKWHYVAATQGASGMVLYVDGLPVGSNTTTTAQKYSGYWRVGGDTNSWGGSSGYVNATIDEAALYLRTLTSSQILAHYKASSASGNRAPTAAFTSNTTNLTSAFDGTGSSDPDGSIASYSWNFGDGTAAGTGATPSHTYAAAGTYTVTLTVTDNQGATGSVTHTVTTTQAANQLPTAAFTFTAANHVVSFDGTGSSDPDGSIASYSWDFGDGTAAGTGATPSHTYAAAGTYTVKLTVTDNRGGTGSVTRSVAVNTAPTAAFTSSASSLVLSVDGTGSSDSDGSIASYSWNFGDGTAAGSGATATHTYAAAGTYSVTLTVTDNGGATGSVTHSVTVTSPGQAPTAQFTSNCTFGSCAFDGTGSTGNGGATIKSYAWDFGDGSTGTGATPTHVYQADGTYSVTLTVTDSNARTAFITKSVTVTVLVAGDAFSRTASGGWGTADAGGTWNVSPSSAFSVNGSQGQILLSAPGSGPTASLDNVSLQNMSVVLDLGTDVAPTGNGVAVNTLVRRSGSNDYRIKVILLPNGVVHLAVSRVVSWSETTLREVVVNGLTYTPGDRLRARLTVSGNGTTTLAGHVWKVGTTEPTTDQISVTDSTAALQTTGSVAFQAYLSGSSTAPMTVSVDNIAVTSH